MAFDGCTDCAAARAATRAADTRRESDIAAIVQEKRGIGLEGATGRLRNGEMGFPQRLCSHISGRGGGAVQDLGDEGEDEEEVEVEVGVKLELRSRELSSLGSSFDDVKPRRLGRGRDWPDTG